MDLFKFNLLTSINIEKRKAKKRNNLVNIVFTAVSFASIFLLIIMYFKTFKIIDDYELSIVTKNNQNQKYENLKKSIKFDKTKINKFDQVYNSRINWPLLINCIEMNILPETIVKGFYYSNDILNLEFSLRADKKTSEKSTILKMTTDFKTALQNDSIFVGFLKDKSEIEMISPEVEKSIENSDYEIWSYTFKVELKPTTKPASARKTGSKKERI
ncbi:MAG: hypothetical protein JXR48_06820 [Candidatus Delongbacteria bacterium]|nr:hypothetical protein [Candidatus Delongbacteria bacterium]MBN2834663.1 hypothetical protein [Candidatus Delongbacteria bacterium]